MGQMVEGYATNGTNALRGKVRSAARDVRAIFEPVKSSIAQIILFIVWLLVATATFIRVVAVWQDPGAASPIVVAFAAGILLVCMLPPILMWCIALIAQKSLNARLKFEIPLDEENGRGAEHAPDRRRLVRAVRERADKFWKYESIQTERARERFMFHATMYGFTSSATLMIGAWVSMKTLARVQALEAAPWEVYGAIAVGTATAVAFSKDFVRMLVRASMRDCSTAMLAWATKRLVVAVVGTTLFVALASTAASDAVNGLVKSGAGSVLLGASVAIVGEQITGALSDRAARVLGISLPKGTGEGLKAIAGLEDDDILRLAEEGVDSVHALALCATPKLFFGTPYSLQRICDWQDQALLIARVGMSRARIFREQLMIRGAIDAQLLAQRLFPISGAQGERDPSERDPLVIVLGFATDAQASAALQHLADDDAISQLAAFRTARPSEALLRGAAQA